MRRFVPGIILLYIITCTLSLYAIDNAHFYRATYFLPALHEPRIATPCLTSFDFTFGGGSTNCSIPGGGCNSCVRDRDCCSTLLNIYGPFNMHALGVGVPCKDLSNPIDSTLTALSLVPAQGTFGFLKFFGNFRITESTFTITQNFDCGFFGQIFLPVRTLSICNIFYCDMTPTDPECANAQNPVWQSFLYQFPELLKRYDLDITSFCSTGVGDLTVLLGWTVNHQAYELLDFFDATIRVGILFPTGKVQNPNKVFSLPLGYNGHFGFPVSLSMALGTCDWFTFGGNIGGLFFASHGSCIRLKTDCAQSGFIKLAKGCANVDLGSILDAHVYLKADHVLCGLSLWLAYSFAQQRQTSIAVSNSECIDPIAASSDDQFAPWRMHTFHFLAEYDFGCCDSAINPRIGVFFNKVVGGERIFDTNMKGGWLGLDICWIF